MLNNQLKGVAVLIRDDFEFEVLKSISDQDGNFIFLNVKTTFGTINLKNINNPKSGQAVLKICEDLDLLDIYRYFYQTTHRYTWRKKNPLKQARLYFFLVSHGMTDLVYNCDIKAGYRSDHSFLFLDFTVNKFSMGKGIWKLNNSLLKNKSYVDLINNVIKQEAMGCALPVYKVQYIESNWGKILFTIDDDLFLETLFLRIRGESIKFSSHLKKNIWKKKRQ